MIEIPPEEELPVRKSSEQEDHHLHHNDEYEYDHQHSHTHNDEGKGEGMVDVEAIMWKTGSTGSMESVLRKPLCPNVQRFVDLISVYEGRVG